MKVLGKIRVTVQYEQNAPVELPLVVIAGNGPSLFGWKWLKHIQLNWKQIGTVMLHNDAKQELNRLLKDYQEIFSDELGTIQTFRAQLAVQDKAKPKVCKPPLALKEAIEEELDCN